ncbi:MAG TPA: TetR family transcriptional regulator C-terminal domain-containing protein [Steroidobacteraceae bacterium]|nr:TetR family transcriptional regulator C-terminal domain-containing protein [Steroidobacteraceae bacterium]
MHAAEHSVTNVSAQTTSTNHAPASRIRQRQRRRLIDACISALHIYGPSRTTVEKVVALADLSPGIVRFYFDSKAAMLVASLQFLSTEFQERVLAPVIALKERPVEALRLLVDLYLDAEIASPRKVSVWYAFWGEASSRQEYLDICGGRDEEFYALVTELMQRLISARGATHLDADGVALGLIGVLEVLWQGFAFQSEANIDRTAAVRRSLAYLRSVFPGEFAPVPVREPPARGGDPRHLPARAYADAALLSMERERLLRPAWQVLGHESELRVPGDYLSAELAGERVMLVCAERDRLHAFRNTCRRSPHALVSERKGRLQSAIRCVTHALTYTFDGQLVEGQTPGDLTPLELTRRGRLLLVRAAPGAAALPEGSLPAEAFDGLFMRAVSDREVAADWKVIIEQWLENPQPHQHFVAPNQLFIVHPGSATILQVFPSAPGASRVRRFEFARGGRRSSRAARATDSWLDEQLALAQSTQSGRVNAPHEVEDAGPVAPALAEFRGTILALLRALPVS